MQLVSVYLINAKQQLAFISFLDGTWALVVLFRKFGTHLVDLTDLGTKRHSKLVNSLWITVSFSISMLSMKFLDQDVILLWFLKYSGISANIVFPLISYLSY